MHRVLGLLLFATLAVGGYLLVAGPELAPAGGGASPLQGYGGSALGLLTGLLLAWLVAQDWRTMPARISAWVRLQRYRLGWVLLGVCAGILLLL
jgi:hypothetical protein